MSIAVELVSLPDNLDWLYAPLEAGWIQYHELIDGTLGLDDIAEMNEALAVKSENQARIDEALKAR